MKKEDLIIDRNRKLFKVDSIGKKCVMVFEESQWKQGEWGNYRTRLYKTKILFVYDDNNYNACQKIEEQISQRRKEFEETTIKPLEEKIQGLMSQLKRVEV